MQSYTLSAFKSSTVEKEMESWSLILFKKFWKNDSAAKTFEWLSIRINQE